jgi:competence protein ComEC
LRETSKLLLERINEKKVDYLKGAHHCSDTSNGRELLGILKPAIATCSVGKANSYGHPSFETIETFKDLGVKYYLTDKHGRITLKTDGSKLTIKTEK